SGDSTVTYTEVCSPFKDLSDIGSLGVVVYGYDGLSIHPPSSDYVPEPKNLPSPDYVPGPEHPPSHVYLQYVSKLAYLKFMPPEDDVLPEDSNKDDEDPKDDPADYPTDRDDDDDDDEEESSVSPPVYHTTARMSFQTQRLWFFGTLDAEIRCDLDREIGYGITEVLEDPNEIAVEIPMIDVAELSKRMTDFGTTVRQDTDEIYRRLDNVQDDRLLMSGQLNSLRRDRRSHALIARLIESEARASREAWTQMTALQSQERPARDLAHTNVPEEADSSFRSGYILAMFYSLLSITGSQNGKDNHDSGTGVRRQAPPARECTYPNFMKCKPLYFKGTEGTNLKKKMTDKYCPRDEIKKLEVKMWNSKVRESNKIKRYVCGLPHMIYRSVMASKTKTMQDAFEFATELMDKKICTFAEHQTKNKRKSEDTARNN
nr:hypothetical protein [Tanacetum cinerariifolium]